MSNWTLFSNHGHVLFCLARDRQARLRDVAADVGITERAVQKIVRDLQDGGMISVAKSGRRNRYRIHKKQSLRHEIEASCKVRDLIKVVNKDINSDTSGAGADEQVNKPRQAHEPPPGVADTGLTTAVKPNPEQAESTKRASVTAETEKLESPESIEKQQGSLF